MMPARQPCDTHALRPSPLGTASDSVDCPCTCVRRVAEFGSQHIGYTRRFQRSGPEHFQALRAAANSPPRGREKSLDEFDAAVAQAIPTWNGIELRLALLRSCITGAADTQAFVRVGAVAALSLIFEHPNLSARALKAALFTSAASGLPRVVSALVCQHRERLGDLGIDLNDLLWSAFCHRCVEVVEVLLQHGADPNMSTPTTPQCPLLVQCAATPCNTQLHVRLLRVLLRHGARTDAVDSQSGLTALHLSANNANHEACAVLLAAGVPADIPADLAAIDAAVTPLFYAAVSGDECTARTLLNAGASPYFLARRSAVPLVAGSVLWLLQPAVAPKMVALLIREGPPRPVAAVRRDDTSTRLEYPSALRVTLPRIAGVGSHGRDPYLELAASAGHVVPVMAMLDARTVDADGNTTHGPVDGRVAALAAAVQAGHATIVDAILKRGWPGAASHCCNACAEAEEAGDGFDPHAAFLLAAASALGAESVVTVLLRHDAHRRIDAVAASAALVEAAVGGHQGIVSRLTEAGCGVSNVASLQGACSQPADPVPPPAAAPRAVSDGMRAGAQAAMRRRLQARARGLLRSGAPPSDVALHSSDAHEAASSNTSEYASTTSRATTPPCPQTPSPNLDGID